MAHSTGDPCRLCFKDISKVDVFAKAKRSEVMSRVRARGNHSTELRMISIFRAHGISGWRRNRPVLGRPDFVFPAGRVVVFVDGCFWHGCPWHGRVPVSNVAILDERPARRTPHPQPLSPQSRGEGSQRPTSGVTGW